MDDLEKCKQKTLVQYACQKKNNGNNLQKIKDCKTIKQLLELRCKLGLVEWDKK